MKHKLTRTEEATVDVDKVSVAILKNRGTWTIEIRDAALPPHQVTLEGEIVRTLDGLIPSTLVSLGYELEVLQEAEAEPATEATAKRK